MNKKAYIRFTIVPEMIKQIPSDKSWSQTRPFMGSTNCGKKVRKNSPTFGLSNVAHIPL